MRERLKHDIAPEVRNSPEPVTVRLTGLSGLVDFVRKAAPELAANAMLCAVNQAAYLLLRLLDSQSRDFVEQGGFTEKLYEARVKARGDTNAPDCPTCGKQMKKRTAGKGANAGKPFWGCSAYPQCRGIINIA